MVIDSLHHTDGSDTWLKQGYNSIINFLFNENKPDMATQDEIDQIPCIQGGKNQSGANQPFPLILGETYYTPMYIGTPYVTIDTSKHNNGEDEYFSALYCLGQNDIEVRDFQLGIYKLASNQEGRLNGDIEIDSTTYPTSKYDTRISITALGENPIYPQKIVQENFNAQLLNVDNNPLVVRPFSARYTQRVRLEILFQSLIAYSDEGEKENATVELGFAYSLGNGFYMPLVQDGVYGWGNSSDVTIVKKENRMIGTDTYAVYSFTAKKSKQMRFALDHTFTWQNALGTIDLGDSAFEFNVVRFTPESEDNKIQDKCYFTRITSWCFNYKESMTQQGFVSQTPINGNYKTKIKTVGFKIKSGDEIQGTLNEFNCIVKAKGRTYNDVTKQWSSTTSVTSNPASMALMVMQSDYRGKYKYNDNQIDLESLGELYTHCNELRSNLNGYRYVVNGVLNSQKKTFEILSTILATANAYLVLKGTKYGVFIDKPQETPVMILNNQNILEASNSKAFEEPTHAIKAKFINSTNYYKEDTYLCVPNKYQSILPSEKNITETEFLYYTDPKRVYIKAMRLIAEKELRPEVWNRKVAIEGNLIEIGDLIELQDDTISVGIGNGAEIIEVITDSQQNIIGIKTDGEFTISQQNNYAVKVTQADGIHQPIVKTYRVTQNSQGTYTTFNFVTPISADTLYKPCFGDIVTFGIYEKETVQALCFGKKDNGDGTFNLVFVPYNEDIYNSENGNIPEFVSNVTTPIQNGMRIDNSSQYATIDDVENRFAELNSGALNIKPFTPNITECIALRDNIRVKCNVSNESLNKNVKLYIWYLSKIDGEMVKVGETSTNEFVYNFNRTTEGYPEGDELTEWDFYVKGVNVYGKESDLSQGRVVDVSNYGTWIPQSETNFTAKAMADGTGISFNWNTLAQENYYGTNEFIIEYKYKKDNEWLEPIIESTLQKFYTRYFDRTYEEYPEAQDLNNIQVTFKVRCKESGSYGGTSFYDGTLIDKTDYLTWIPTIAPSVTGDGRTCNINLKTDNSHYGTIKYQVKIKRLTSSYINPITSEEVLIQEDNDFYEINNSSSEIYTNEDSYKDVLCITPRLFSTNFNQTLPLVGQNFRGQKEEDEEEKDYPCPSNTFYQYEVIGKVFDRDYLVSTTNTEYVYYTARPTGASDLADNAITNNKLTPNCVKFENLDTGILSAENIATYGLLAKSAIIGKLNGNVQGKNNYWDLESGSFRIGNEEQFFEVRPIENDGVITDYEITLKAGNISLTSNGIDFDEDNGFEKGIYFYDENDSTLRLHLVANGIIIEKDISNDNNWTEIELKGKMYLDNKGNFILTNTKESPEPAIFVDNVNCYNFNRESFNQDENGVNSESINVTGFISNQNKFYETNKLMNGTITKTIDNTKQIFGVVKGGAIDIGDTSIYSDITDRFSLSTWCGFSDFHIPHIQINITEVEA